MYIFNTDHDKVFDNYDLILYTSLIQKGENYGTTSIYKKFETSNGFKPN